MSRTGRDGPGKPQTGQKVPDEVDEAGDESFPSSDPPSWTPTHAGQPPPVDERSKADRKGKTKRQGSGRTAR